jgi:DNA topoisomerase-1
MPGIRRLRSGRGFRYVDARGRLIRGRAELDRIRRIVVPPAWRDVWICPNPNGHIQSVGRDARGRKQYRYHPHWRTVRDESKYEQILEFAAALPALRQRIAKDLAGRGLSKRKVVAAVVQLLEKTLIRVGNDEYTRDNHSFGLTTLRTRHVRISRSTLRFRFKGKGRKVHEIDFNDSRLARIVRQCQELPGHELFQYLDDQGEVQDVGSADVNEYLREATGRDFTAKNFRTWIGTVLAAHAFQQVPDFRSDTEAKRNIVKVVEAVAGILGNTPSICRKSYLHPAVLDAYIGRQFQRSSSSRARAVGRPFLHGLARTESAVLRLLRNQRPRDTRRRAA